MRYVALVVLLGVVCCGCVATDRYKACLADTACYAEMEAARASAYNVTKSAAGFPGVPSVPEVLALLVSNLAAFGVGVLKGRKVKGA